MKLGLQIFDICDVGCYTESSFHICAQKDLFKSNYNRQIIKKRAEPMHPRPIYVGVIELDPEWVQSQITVDHTLATQALGDISMLLNEPQFSVLAAHVKAGTLRAVHHIFPCSSIDVLPRLQRVTSQLSTFICWKLTKINFTAVESSRGFGSLIAMYVSLGQRILYNASVLTHQLQLKAFTNSIKLLRFPLEPANTQDCWFDLHKNTLLQYIID